ncbi:hypothetical protein LJB89_02495, partial [Tyzzerella sp. OttesenSCG-928-J15]|nr:hypothetical protein [Tyzzerella sp. OttesenSCG-928-J15]
MFVDFGVKLSEQLVINRFEPLKGFFDKDEITEETRLMGFINTFNSAWYAVVVINTAAIDFEDYKAKLQEHINNYFEKLIELNGKKNIVVVNLFVSQAASEYDLFMDEDKFVFDRPVVNAFWQADLLSKTLKVAKNNPDRIINIKEITEFALSGGEVNGEASFGKIYQSAANKRKNVKPVNNSAPYLTYGLIIINMLIMAVLELNSSRFYDFMRFGALSPEM